MKILLCFINLFFLVSGSLLAQNTVKESLTRAEFIRSQTVKADTLNEIALKLATPGASSADLNEAIRYIMQGLHVYSKFRDSTGLRETFDHLAMVYHLQKKYVQAKWFYIQSNSLSRDMKDTINIIHSLVNLSSVKTDIKDYPMAQRDLTEALSLAKNKAGIELQIDVDNNYARFYTKKGELKRAEAFVTRVGFLKDSVSKAKLLALRQQQDQQQMEKQQIVAQKEAALQREELELQKIAIQKNRIVMIAAIIIIFLTGFCLKLYFKRKRKNNTRRE